jgi:hypothetical protein
MKVRANGLSLPDLDTLASLETGRYWTPAKRPSEPLYRPAINNGYWAEDIITNGLVLYVPLWLYSGSKFPSVDAYKHTCTVTGATWGLQGRTFDGIDDKILSGVSPVSLTNKVTILVWYKPAGITGIRSLFQYCGVASGGIVINMNQSGAGSAEGWREEPGWAQSNVILGASSIGTWTCLHLTYDGATFQMGKDLTFPTGASVSGNLSRQTDPIATIGCQFGGGQYAYGVIGEVILYSRAFTIREMQHNYLATKWRYA